MKNIGILGAGISGLTLAWYLKQYLGNEVKITIIDKQDRLGGWINTYAHDNFLFEQGPRGCRPKGKGLATLQLIEELELENEVIGADPSSQIRYLYIDGKMQKIPTSFLSFLCSPLTRDSVPAIMKELFIPQGNKDDESIYSFIARRFNSKIANTFIDPMTSGIYAGNIHELSMRACFPKLHDWEKEKGSILKGMLFGKKDQSFDPTTPFQKKMQKYALFSFQNGLSCLIETLAMKLDCEFILNANVKSLRAKDHRIELTIENNKLDKQKDKQLEKKLDKQKDEQHFQFDHLFSTISPTSLAPLIPIIQPLLNKIPVKSITLVNVGFNSNVLKLKGFGYLIPSQEKEKILGAVWDSSTFPQQNRTKEQTRITFMMNYNSNTNPPEIVHDALKRHLEIYETPNHLNIHHTKEAIPQYLVGHNELVKKIEHELLNYSENITLLGTAFYGAGVNDCVFTARNISQIFCKKNDKRNTIEKKRTT